MEASSSTDKKKSFLIATLIYVVLLILLFFIRFWPPSDQELATLAGGGGGGGVTINFGDSELGSGADFKSEVLDVKSQAKATPTNETPDDAILSQDNASDDNDVVIPKKEKLKTPVPIKKEIKPEVVKPKVNSNANSALANILNGKNKGGDGDDKTSGNKGKANGDKNSNGYYGSGGSGGGTGGGTGTGNGTGTGPGSGSGTGGGNGSGSGNGSGYSLGGRKPLSKPKPEYACGNESGIVVVQITVDKNGNPVDAKPGSRGTTNTSSCLWAEAKKAALKTKWEPSPNGAEKQVGSITYSFTINN